MSIIDLFTNLLINLPVLNLSSLGSNKNVILINLKELCWLVAQLELLNVDLSPRLQIDNGDIHNALGIDREAEHGG